MAAMLDLVPSRSYRRVMGRTFVRIGSGKGKGPTG